MTASATLTFALTTVARQAGTITLKQMLATADDPMIRPLKISAFSAEDAVNLILQRSEIICDQKYPGRVIEA